MYTKYPKSDYNYELVLKNINPNRNNRLTNSHLPVWHDLVSRIARSVYPPRISASWFPELYGRYNPLSSATWFTESSDWCIHPGLVRFGFPNRTLAVISCPAWFDFTKRAASTPPRSGYSRPVTR